MSTPPISRYPVPELAGLPDDLRARILEVQAKAGFVPNVFLALAHRPAEWRAFMAYHDALLLKDTGSLSKGEREMIIVATSAANQCLYCVVAHGAILRVYEKAPLLAEATRNAREQAQKFAAEAGASLGPLRSANQGVIQIGGADGQGFDDGSSRIKRLRVVSSFQYTLQ